jgi:hypothetical protein
MTLCSFTTEELRQKARFHRKMAEFDPTYRSDRNADAKRTHYQATQVRWADLFDELADRRDAMRSAVE